MKNVTIIWEAFSNATYGKATFTTIAIETEGSDLDICNQVFHDTNLYSGPIWDVLEKVLPWGRTHTALSVGDTIAIDGKSYRCEPLGWSLLEGAEA